MILVTGATGQLGKATIDALLQRLSPGQIKGLARDKSKATELVSSGIDVREGDYHDYGSLIEAFDGIDKVLLISAHGFTDRVAQHKNVINAASAAGVKHLFYTSIQRSSNYIMPEVTKSDLETETHLKKSGINYTILRNNLYLDGISFLLGNDVLQKGVAMPAGAGKAAFITRADIAAAMAELLIGDGHENKEYNLSGNEAWSFPEIAALLSDLAGHPIPYIDVKPEQFIAQRVEEGLPQPFAAFLAEWGAAIKNGMLAGSDDTIERLTGRKPVSMKEYLLHAYFKTV